MEKVTGIGGLFFRSRDPQALGRWYESNLGITLTPSSYDELPWHQDARLIDPEGNPIELWEPLGRVAAPSGDN
jgi:hypothetical protein